MKNNTNIITDIDALKLNCSPVSTLQEGEDIANQLFRELNEYKGAGVGLAAIQVGILKRVCVVNALSPLYFINPIVTPVEDDGKFVYLETCLSMPLVVARTHRWRTIKITADNLDSEKIYSIVHIPQDEVMNSPEALEVACIQHEVDHLSGILMQERIYIESQFHITDDYGRNQKITIVKGTNKKQIKYKQFDSFKNDGWIIEP